MLFIGGAGNDIFEFSATNLASTDFVNGKGGSNELMLTTFGTISANGVIGVETYELAIKGENTLTLGTGNFVGVTGKVITVDDGSGGNTISERSVAAADRVVMKGGSGKDTLIAGPNAAMTGGGGKDVFELTTPGSVATPDTNTIADFVHGADEVAYSESGFALGSNPVAATLFTADANSSFSTAAQRFSYDTSNGRLYCDAHGDAHGSSRLLIAALTGAPNLTVADLAFAA